MARTVLLLLLAIALAGPCSCEETHQLGRIVVTPSRIRTDSAQSASSVLSLGESDFGSFGSGAISDVIARVGGIDIRRRGVEGVQSDINMRASNFEQNTVLIDGTAVNDPQTGHFNMDLPITMLDVDRIEIVKGPASSVYGPNSFGGVINIITKKPDRASVTINSEGGSYDFFAGGLAASIPLGVLKNRFSIEERRSSGYMPETEFNILSLSDSILAETPFGEYNFLFGYAKKDFGADSFYSNLYPNEEEHTDTRFFKIDGTSEAGPLKIMPRLSLRRHGDKFALDRNRPGWQTNYHTNYSYGGELNFSLENNWCDVAYGFELARDTIDSTNIKAHRRGRGGAYVELLPKILDALYLNIAVREDYFSSFGWESSPSVSLKFPIAEGLSLRSHIGRAYRIPTFTDLYYNDAANIGDANLRPESSWSYEAGVDYRTEPMNLSVTYFHRNSFDTIDWTRQSSRDPWRVSNTGTIDTNGVETHLEVVPQKIDKRFLLDRAFLGYTALDSYRKHDYLSKYTLDYLKQHISAGFSYHLFDFENSWTANYKKRVGDSGYIVVDTRVMRGIIRKDTVALEAFLEISNIFDADYSEQSGVPMPGRRINAGATLEF